MSNEETKMQTLDDLPDEVLLRVLAGAGSKAILRAATCCRRLYSLYKTLQSHRCFSAAASTKSDLGDALQEACERALQGTLGCVDFALVFTANYDKLKGALAGKVVKVLLPRLPPGTAVVGCATAGLMGVGPGGAFELDPSSGGGRITRGSPGVALLLGRMPGCRVRAFCNLLPPQPPLPGGTTSAGTAAAAGGGRGDGRGPPRRRSVGQVVPLGNLKRENANRAVVEWLRRGVAAADAGTSTSAEDPTSNTIVTTAAVGTTSISAPAPVPAPASANTITSANITVVSAAVDNVTADDGSGAGGHGSRSRRRGVDDGKRGTTPVAAAALESVWGGAVESEPLASARDLALQSVWLLLGGSSSAFDLLDGPGGLLHWLQADKRAWPVIAGGVSSGSGDLIFHPGSKQRGYGAAAEAAAEADEAEAEAEAEGGPSSSSGRKRGGATAAVDLGDWDSAAVKGLQYVGLAVMAEAPAAASTAAQQPAGAVPEPPLAAVRACALAMRGCAGLPGQRIFERVSITRGALPGSRPHGAANDSEDEDEEEHEGVGELLTVTGGVSSGSKSLLEESRAVWSRTHSLPQLAVWLARRGDASLHSGLDVQVFRSGKMAMGLMVPSLLAHYGIVAFRTTDMAAVDAITAGAQEAGAVVCCQLADITPEGCRMHLHAELPVLRSVASPYPLLPGGRPDPRSWEGYALVRLAALRAGARAGPVAMAVFSCTGRGRSIFGEAGAECEARIADLVLQQGVPFVGAYCNGELGPYVRHGYAGWFFNPLCVQPPDAGAVAGTVTTAATGPATTAATAGVEGPPRNVSATVAAAVSTGAVSPAGPPSRDASPPRCTVVAGGRVLPLDRTLMQGYTSVYAALG